MAAKNRLPHFAPVHTGVHRGIEYWVLRIRDYLPEGYYCGYCRLPISLDGREEEISVHGDVTFAERDEDGSWVYGFDCAHWGDDAPNSPTRNLDWVVEETKRMIDEILEGADR